MRLCVSVSVCLHVWRGHEFCGRLALSAGIFKAKQTDRQKSSHVLFSVAFDVDLSLFVSLLFFIFCLRCYRPQHYVNISLPSSRYIMSL